MKRARLRGKTSSVSLPTSASAARWAIATGLAVSLAGRLVLLPELPICVAAKSVLLVHLHSHLPLAVAKNLSIALVLHELAQNHQRVDKFCLSEFAATVGVKVGNHLLSHGLRRGHVLAAKPVHDLSGDALLFELDTALSTTLAVVASLASIGRALSTATLHSLGTGIRMKCERKHDGQDWSDGFHRISMVGGV